MSWTYLQHSGELADPDGAVIGTGYSGFGSDKNRPEDQAVAGCGPIPQGEYTISVAQNSVHLGPTVMALIPEPSNEMFGRGGFFIHGDSIQHPGQASHGCVIQPRGVRQLLASSPDKQLLVKP